MDINLSLDELKREQPVAKKARGGAAKSARGRGRGGASNDRAESIKVSVRNDLRPARGRGRGRAIGVPAARGRGRGAYVCLISSHLLPLTIFAAASRTCYSTHSAHKHKC